MNCKTCTGPCCLNGSNHEGDCEGYKPMTNADRIRDMTDEELAEWIAGRAPGTSADIWLDWLRQEATDD